jgi:hypothetical protein
MEPAISRALLLAVLVGACHGSVAEDLQGFLQVRSFLSQRNEQQYKIATANGIDEARYVPVGGSEQYISIRGEDRANPVMLFLHGGAGRCDESLGLSGVPFVAQALHSRAMGSARRRQDVAQERRTSRYRRVSLRNSWPRCAHPARNSWRFLADTSRCS